MTEPVRIAGVGTTPFVKPSASEPHHVLAASAARLALADAGLAYTDMQPACAGYVYGDSTSGQRALYELDIGIGGACVVTVCERA